jgi:uncharacterized protein YjbI with pentapeptide repeats
LTIKPKLQLGFFILGGTMNTSILKKITSWIASGLFLVLLTGFSLLSQPSANAQSQTPFAPVEPTPTPVISPVTVPIQSVSANVRRLLQTNECAGCNLTGAVLKDTNLQAANLEGANLQNADLERANLEGTNLIGANLQGADLGKTNIAGANLERANLFDADLEKANLLGANLLGANLRGADLEDAILPPGFAAY